jgi:uncharacterized membrane protein
MRLLVLILVVIPSAGVIGIGFTGNLIAAILGIRRREPRWVALHIAACGVAIVALLVYPSLFPAHVVGGGGLGPGF